MTWLKGKLNWVLPAHLSSPREPACCVPDDLPVHRPEVIAQLADELSEQADALRYRDNFARLLPKRIQDLDSDLRSRKREEAEGTLLSLAVGSTMVGAPRLLFVADQCLVAFRSGREMSYLPALGEEAERFLSYLAGPDDADPEPSSTRPDSSGAAIQL